MDICEITSDVIVGIIVGLLSSSIVSFGFYCKEDRRAYERYKDALVQYLYSLFDLLFITEHCDNCSALLKRLSEEPMDEWRHRYKGEELETKKEIEQLRDDLLLFCHTYNGTKGKLGDNTDLTEWQNIIPQLATQVKKMRYPKRR